MNYSDLDRQGNIYESMVNRGNINLLQNEEIIDRLRRLEETYIYLNRMEAIHFEAVIQLMPDLMQTIRFYDSKVENSEFLYSFQAQNMFVIILHVMDEKEVVYERALNEIDAILQLIEVELN